jgi:hypothetical protein
MTIIIPSFTEPRDPKASLVEMTNQTFEATVALSYAIDQGIISAFVVASDDDGKALCEIIFPLKPDSEPDAPNPTRTVYAQTPISALAAAGENIHKMIELEHSNSANHNDFITAYIERRNLRKQIIVAPQPSRS